MLLWRPAELLNGRLAMIGFTAALANEAITGASLWQQLYFAPYAYLSAYLLVVAAAQLNRAFGSPIKGKSSCWPFSVLQLHCHLTKDMCLLNGIACLHQECCRCFSAHVLQHFGCMQFPEVFYVTWREAPAVYSIDVTLSKQDAAAQSMP